MWVSHLDDAKAWVKINGMEEEFSGTMSFSVVAALFEGGLALLAVGIGWALGRQPLDTFHFSFGNLGWSILATLPLLGFFRFSLKSSWQPFAQIRKILDETFLPLFRQCSLLELAMIAFLAGLGEEMLFRGVVQGWIGDKIGGPWGIGLGLTISAVIFGLLHGITLTYAILAFGIGLYLGVVWQLTGNLFVPITIHALYDFLALVYLLCRPTPETTPPSDNLKQEK
jgi:membrane protease YdiL (CAAX protease family)